jgi:hypothetical protein
MLHDINHFSNVRAAHSPCKQIRRIVGSRLLRRLVASGLIFAASAENSFAAAKIYWTTCCDTLVRRANLDGSDPEAILQTDGGLALAVDAVNRQMYIAAPGAGGILRSDLDGSGSTLIISGVTPYRVAVDSINAKLYWADLVSTIWRSNLDGTGREPLITNGPLVQSIAVDPAGGYFYWTDFIQGVQRSPIDHIKSEFVLDRSTFGFLPDVLAIALDVDHGNLYAADSGFSQIYRLGLDGSEPTILIKGAEVVLPASIAVDSVGGRIYWGNGSLNRPESFEFLAYVMSAQLDGSDVRKVFLMDNFDEARHLVIVQDSLPEPGGVCLAIVALMAVGRKGSAVRQIRR